MLIANPIYDTVFKFMMENLEIAKGVISTIIDEEIQHLEFKAQEKTVKIDETVTVFHLDFIARIKEKDGGFKNVLIEMQKSNLPYNITRFRRYIGEQYKRQDEFLSRDGQPYVEPLPILTIYFLGFYVSQTLPAVIKVNRKYIDVLGGQEIKERSDFIELLCHDSFVIQIPALQVQMRTRLERLLSVFKQENFISASHYLKNYAYETGDGLVNKILKQLEKAAADNELMQKLELEEMVGGAFDEMQKKLCLKEEAILKSKKEIEKRDNTIKEKDNALKEKDNALQEKENYIKELLEKLDRKSS